MTDDPDLDPTDDALERSPWCLLMPTGYPDDPDIIGPFTSFEDAEIWSRTYPGVTDPRGPNGLVGIGAIGSMTSLERRTTRLDHRVVPGRARARGWRVADR